jgi:hypothetical protein
MNYTGIGRIGNRFRQLFEAVAGMRHSGGLVILIRGGAGCRNANTGTAIVGRITCYKKVVSRSNSFSWIFIFPAGTQRFEIFFLGGISHGYSFFYHFWPHSIHREVSEISYLSS